MDPMGVNSSKKAAPFGGGARLISLERQLLGRAAGRFLSLPRLVVAAAVNGWALRPHRTQIARKLPAMVNTVIVQEPEIHHGGQVEDTIEINGCEQLLGRHGADPVDGPGEFLLVRSRQFARCLGLV